MNGGILLVDKEVGITSRQLDNKAQKLFHTRKVGHLGTLDPFATGLMVVAVDKGGKYLNYLDDQKKRYVATLKLGYRSSTGDLTGEISEVPVKVYPSEETVKETLSSFIGKSEQIPPMTSAIKVNGTALYELAHKGVEIERKARPIEIYEINLVSLEKDVIVFDCLVSKGTYIRTLGEDIAKKLGTEGYLTALRRTEIGSLSVENAKKWDDITLDDLVEPTPYVYCPLLEVSEIDANRAKNGLAMKLDKKLGEKVLLTYQNTGVAIYVLKEDGLYHSERGLF
ncbi:MAG: tRNA pseudouridine(55) synthase TruB [Bacilli bacterium]|nr:tRNA pseudouridine(55) synthase TruB [Bacilli bacterium]